MRLISIIIIRLEYSIIEVIVRYRYSLLNYKKIILTKKYTVKVLIASPNF